MSLGKYKECDTHH